MLPNYHVQNKGVPGYGLVQMYLALKSEVEKGNKPKLAVFNYASFQDERTPLSRHWIENFRYAVVQSGSATNAGMVYPYGTIKEGTTDSLIIGYCHWNDWSKDFLFRDKSAFINLCNTSYTTWHDHKNEALFRTISELTAFKIIAYCKQNGIAVVFAGMTNDTKFLLDKIASKGNHTLLFMVDVMEPGFNCAPLDPGHPNARAHREYAREVYAYITSAKLITMDSGQ